MRNLIISIVCFIICCCGVAFWCTPYLDSIDNDLDFFRACVVTLSVTALSGAAGLAYFIDWRAERRSQRN